MKLILLCILMQVGCSPAYSMSLFRDRPKDPVVTVPSPTPTPIVEPTPSPTPAPTPVPTPKPPGIIAFKIPGFKQPWSDKVKAMLNEPDLWAQFQAARGDFQDRFCPNYSKLGVDLQRLAWGFLVGAVVSFESSYNPNSAFEESNGDWSEGLLQLTYGNSFCPKSKAAGNIRDPIINLNCGVRIMGKYLAQDRVVASGGYPQYGAPPPKGLARYWAVIRVPDSKRQHDLKSIIAMTKTAPGCL